MPWRSRAQARWGHTAAGRKALGGARAVSEWDAATDWGNLPARKGGRMGPKIKGYIARAAEKRAKRQQAADMSRSKRKLRLKKKG